MSHFGMNTLGVKIAKKEGMQLKGISVAENIHSARWY